MWIDWSQHSLLLSLASITFNPTAWNIVARNEYRNKTLTKIFGGPYAGCYFLAFAIFSFGMLRDTLYKQALLNQPQHEILPEPLHLIVPIILFVVGQTFVLTSTYALGITGTFLGDYFGILMDHRVEGFPFNIVSDPMYLGSTMCFAAAALWYERPAGLFVTLYVHIAYSIALRFEGPFTAMIYSIKNSKPEQTKKDL